MKICFDIMVSTPETPPLQGLLTEAPAISQLMVPDLVAFPFSNDDSIASFQNALNRVVTPEYRQAPNPVAVLIGESSLSTTIQYIPEQTIVLLDCDEPMVQHMVTYVDTFRSAPNPVAWKWHMGLGQEMFLNLGTRMDYERALSRQVDWWEGRGIPHALHNEAAFRTSQVLFRQKTIVPWRGDVTSEEDMLALGIALRKYNAIITLLNLTNVIPYAALEAVETQTGKHLPEAADYADILAHLPVTANIPILTASRMKLPGKSMLGSTGPFHGLSHLREGGNSIDGPVAVLKSMKY